MEEDMQSVGVTETLSYPDSIPSILNRDRVRWRQWVHNQMWGEQLKEEEHCTLFIIMT